MSFDEWMNKNHSGAFDMPHQRDAYEAGAASRQVEIDELKAELEILQGMHNAASLYAGKLIDERDELQKRIDEALSELDEAYKKGIIEKPRVIVDSIKILKGKKDE